MTLLWLRETQTDKKRYWGSKRVKMNLFFGSDLKDIIAKKYGQLIVEHSHLYSKSTPFQLSSSPALGRQTSLPRPQTCSGGITEKVKADGRVT